MIRSVLALACLAAVATAHPGMSVDDAALTMRQASGATSPSAATPPTQLAIALQGKFGDSRRRSVRCSNHLAAACHCNGCETKYHYSNVATFGDTRRRRRRRPTYYSYSPTYACRSDKRNAGWSGLPLAVRGSPSCRCTRRPGRYTFVNSCLRNPSTAEMSKEAPLDVSINAVSSIGSCVLGTTRHALTGMFPLLSVKRFSFASISSG